MTDLYKEQIQLELESKGSGAERALQKLQESLERDEGSTNHGKKIIYALYKNFQESTANFVETQTKKNLFYANYYIPSTEHYEELESKYKDVREFMSHPYNLIPYTIAREITKSVQKESKLTNVAKILIDTLISSYNLKTDVESNVLASTVAFVRYLVENSDLLEIYHNNKSTVCIKFTESVMNQAQWAIDHIQPNISHEPMIISPREHKSLTDEKGGYILINSPLLKHPEKSVCETEFDVKAINKMQSTPYRINKVLLGLYEELGLLDIEPNGEAIDEIKIKEKQVRQLRWALKNEENEFIKELQKYNAQKLEDEALEQLSDFGKKSQLQRTIGLIEKFKDYDKIWFPLFCDNRGRVYNYCTDLSVQGTKLGKHVIEFAEGIEITAQGFEALMIAFGGTCGMDKYTFEKRVEKAQEVLPLVDAFFENDSVEIFDHIDPDEIYYGIGLMLEIYRARTIENYVSHFIVYVDSCASGTQISALMTKSGIGAELSNLYNPDSDKLTDAYTIVASAVKEDYKRIAEMSDLDIELMLHYKLEELFREAGI